MADTLIRDNEGVLTLGGVSLPRLAARYGTPLYLMDVATIRARLNAWTAAVPAPNEVYFAGKAFLCRALIPLLQSAGVGLDVVSGGELLTALAAGMPPSRITFHGNLKTIAEMRIALAAGVGRVVADSDEELVRWDRLAAEAGRSVEVWLRLTPGVDPHTHRYITTGHVKSKFGWPLEGGAAEAAVGRALRLPHVRLTGYHAHIGSQILESRPYEETAEHMMAFARAMHTRYQFWPRYLDLGGGLGISDSGEEAPTPQELADAFSGIVTRGTPPGERVPIWAVEPGRSVVAQAGVTLYRVGVVKRAGDGTMYVVVDGGMGDNIRPALYEARYRALPVHMASGAPAPVTIAGRYCESGDLLVEDAVLPPLEPDDLLVVLDTGAYGYVMASQYNRVPVPAVVAVEDGTSSVWVEGLRWDEVHARDRAAPWPS